AAAATENERERQWIQEAMRRSRELRERNAEHPPGEPPDREKVNTPRPPKPETPPEPATPPQPRSISAEPKVPATAKPSPKPQPQSETETPRCLQAQAHAEAQTQAEGETQTKTKAEAQVKAQAQSQTQAAPQDSSQAQVARLATISIQMSSGHGAPPKGPPRL